MPRKTKEVTQKAKEIEEKDEKKVAKKDSLKSNSKSPAKSTQKKATNTKKTTTKKVAKSSSTSKSTKTTKATKATKKTSKTKKTSTRKKENIINEYYDLPYRYNQTVVKILAQTPNNLFVYWDISDKDRETLKKQYGNDFFEKTKPVLIVHNDTLNYSFEVEINDFANSWYLHVNDSKSDYRIELGRRPIDYNKFNEDIKTFNNNISYNIDYIKISNSNEIESPNDRILFNPNEKMIYYKNVKTNETIAKPIAQLSFMQNMGKIYNIYELYKQIYKDENIYDLKNPSSGNPSSGSLSSSKFQ